jgi:hypothetical protein
MSRASILPALLLLGCNVNMDNATETDDPFGTVAGFVTDTQGNSLSDVEVSVQGFTTITDADGHYEVLGLVPDDRFVVSFHKQGYATGHSFGALHGWETTTVDSSLLEIDGYGTFDASTGGFIEVPVATTELGFNRYVEVEFAGGTIIDSNGSPYNGNVTVEITYLDPSNAEDMKAAPGDLTAEGDPNDQMIPAGGVEWEDDNTTKNASVPTQLVSYGMADITLYAEDGDRLNLQDGANAGVSIPITNGELIDWYVLASEDEVPSWSWDEERGLWRQENGGVVTEDDTGELAFEFEAAHFSWWNCDQSYQPTWACGRVVDMLGFPVRSAKVIASGSVSYSIAYTDADGYYEVQVMAGDTVAFEGKTYVAGTSSWKGNEPAMFIDGGESQDTCVGDEVPDIQIEVCRETGVVMTDNIQATIETVDKGTADRLRAWFWDPPGNPEYCANPWDDIDWDSLVTFDLDEHVLYDRETDGLPMNLRGVGQFVEVSTDRTNYMMNKESLGDRISYTWHNEEFDSDSEDYITRNDVDFQSGDVIGLRAPGEQVCYSDPSDPNLQTCSRGSLDEQNWVTIPDAFRSTNLNLSQTQGISSGAGLSVNFDGQNNPDGIIVMASSGTSGFGLVGKYHDDGSLSLPGNVMSELDGASFSLGFFRPELAHLAGPDGLPIRVQAFSGEIFESTMQ